jgi:hypothetical protein
MGPAFLQEISANMSPRINNLSKALVGFAPVGFSPRRAIFDGLEHSEDFRGGDIRDRKIAQGILGEAVEPFALANGGGSLALALLLGQQFGSNQREGVGLAFRLADLLALLVAGGVYAGSELAFAASRRLRASASPTRGY